MTTATRDGALKGETLQRVVDAAIELFARKGYEGVGIREIADAVGMRSASLYHYFGTKEALLVSIMRDSHERFLRAAWNALNGVAQPEEQVVALTRMHVASHARNQFHAVVDDNELRSLSEESRREIVPLRDAYEDLWKRVLEHGEAIGRFHFSNPNLARLALLQMCTGVAAWYDADGPLSLPEICDAYANMTLALLRAKRGGRPVALAQLHLPPAQVYIDLVEAVYLSDDVDSLLRHRSDSPDVSKPLTGPRTLQEGPRRRRTRVGDDPARSLR
jgi:AcrR family transcriptional regulator